jgi:hypothetical protein
MGGTLRTFAQGRSSMAIETDSRIDGGTVWLAAIH